MHVTTADSSLLYVHPNVMLIPKLGDFAVLERNVLDRLQHKCGVLHFISYVIEGIRSITYYFGHLEGVTQVRLLPRYDDMYCVNWNEHSEQNVSRAVSNNTIGN